MKNSKILHQSLTIVFAILFMSSCTTSKSLKVEDGYETTIENVDKKSKSDKKLIKEAEKWLGTKYKYGGHSRGGTDCSGFVMEVYLAVYDFKLPRTSKDQQQFCKSIKKSQLRIGDLVFFATGKSKNKVSHVGLYIGNGTFIHASSSKGVVKSQLSQSYYQRTYHSSGRVEGVRKE